jgi:SAM-dependent methyltransferase
LESIKEATLTAMDVRAHQKVAIANRSFYAKCPDELNNFHQFTATSLVREHIENNVDYCLQLINLPNHPGREAVFLDLGTGTGHMIHHLVKHTSQHNIHAIDISEENIRIAKGNFPDVHFVLGDFMMDFDPEFQFAFVTLYSVMHHFYDWQSLLTKIDDCLRQGGVIYIDHDPLDGAGAKVVSFLLKLKHRKNREFMTCEHHLFEDPIDPFRVVEWLSPRYQCRLIYNNLAVLAPIMLRTGLDFSWLLPTALTVDKSYKKMLRHFFCSFGIIAKKL